VYESNDTDHVAIDHWHHRQVDAATAAGAVFLLKEGPSPEGGFGDGPTDWPSMHINPEETWHKAEAAITDASRNTESFEGAAGGWFRLWHSDTVFLLHTYQAHGTHYQGLDSDQKEDIRRQLRDETIAQQLSQPSQPAEQSSSVTGDVDDDTSRLTWRQEQWQTGGKWWQQTPGPGVDLPRFASTKWLPVVREMVQRRAVAEGRTVSDAHAKRYLSETTLRKSLIVIGAPTAADIVHRYNAEGEADWSAAKAADVHAKLATAKSSAGATSNAFVTAIIGAVMHCDEKLLACRGVCLLRSHKA
jgi:hypothetical protein